MLTRITQAAAFWTSTRMWCLQFTTGSAATSVKYPYSLSVHLGENVTIWLSFHGHYIG